MKPDEAVRRSGPVLRAQSGDSLEFSEVVRFEGKGNAPDMSGNEQVHRADDVFAFLQAGPDISIEAGCVFIEMDDLKRKQIVRPGPLCPGANPCGTAP
ncbi:MAG: hypothetical protein ABFD91_11260 [Anaerohalosphaeraceae bacterium]